MRVVVVVDDRVDRRARRPGPVPSRAVELVAALVRTAGGSSGTLAVDLVGWQAVLDGDMPGPAAARRDSAVRDSTVPDGMATATLLAGADLVHVLPGPTHHPAALDRLLAVVPDRPAVVVSVPDRPSLPKFSSRSREPARRWSDRLPRPAAVTVPGRGVRVVTGEPVEDRYVEVTTGNAQVLSAVSIGPGFEPPALARAHDVQGPVILALTADRDAAEAVEVLRAAEALARSGTRPLLVLAGPGPDQSAVTRAIAFAEAAGVRVRLLGRPGRRELARWRATAGVAVVTARDPGDPEGLAGLLMGGVPVAVVRNRAHKAVAARSTTEPAWYDSGESAELTRVLAGLIAAGRQEADSAPVRGGTPALAVVPSAAGPAGPTGRADRSGLVRRARDRHCLPTWDEVAEDVVAVWADAVLAAGDPVAVPTLRPLPTYTGPPAPAAAPAPAAVVAADPDRAGTAEPVAVRLVR